MAVWNSSSLVASDSDSPKKSILKPRVSKQDMKEHKMFGSKRKGILIGKKFKKKGKGIMKGPTSGDESKKGGISPSTEEFDKMMDSVVKQVKNPKKKSMFQRKQFD